MGEEDWVQNRKWGQGFWGFSIAFNFFVVYVGYLWCKKYAFFTDTVAAQEEKAGHQAQWK